MVGKYLAYRATPSKFDGIGCDRTDDDRYDDPDFYFERWDDPRSRESEAESPSMATIAEGVLYQAMRVGLMQKMADAYAEEHGTVPTRFLTPEHLLEELKKHDSEQ